jgi:hypothetical protein
LSLKVFITGASSGIGEALAVDTFGMRWAVGRFKGLLIYRPSRPLQRERLSPWIHHRPRRYASGCLLMRDSRPVTGLA